MRPFVIACYVTSLTLASVLCANHPPLLQDSTDYRMLEDGPLRAFEDGITARAGVRTNFYRGAEDDPWATSPGQLAIEYGQPLWKPEYEAIFEELPAGKRWRLGSNFWTNLWTSFPVAVGETVFEAGFYFLVLEKTKPGDWNLVLLDPRDVTRRQLDPWHVNLKDSGPGVARIPLEVESRDSVTEKLEIKLKVDDSQISKVQIHIFFGTFQFKSGTLQLEVK